MKDEIKEILDDLLFTTTLPNASVKLNKEKLNQLKDYITNLQVENKFAKEYEKQYRIEKSRNEKAIEYIKEHIKYECDDTINGMSFYSHHLYDFKKEDLLNILQGDDKDD